MNDLRTTFPNLPVAKRIHRDTDLPERIDDLRDGEVIQGDGVTLVPVATPGHASDHLCYYMPEEKALFTGDVVLSGSTSVIPSGDGDVLDYMSSLRRLQGLDVRRIYLANGPVIEDGPERIAGYIAHRLLRERQIPETLGDGVDTIPAMVKRIYAEIPVKLHAMAGRSVECKYSRFPTESTVAREDEREDQAAVSRSWGSVTVPGFVSAAWVAWRRYAFGSTPHSFADSIRL